MTSRLLIKEPNIKSATGRPLHDARQILLTLSCRRQVLVLHKIPNPLILINDFNTANRMRLNGNHGSNVLCPGRNTISLPHIMRNQLFKMSWMNFGRKVTVRGRMS